MKRLNVTLVLIGSLLLSGCAETLITNQCPDPIRPTEELVKWFESCPVPSKENQVLVDQIVNEQKEILQKRQEPQGFWDRWFN